MNTLAGVCLFPPLKKGGWGDSTRVHVGANDGIPPNPPFQRGETPPVADCVHDR
jgi:hypothetical protein